MNEKIREMQKKVLKAFSQEASHFALTGGTALELYYLHHRFSADLDFFSSKYDLKEIERLISNFGKFIKVKLKLELEFIAANRAKVRFYTVPIPNSERPLKIDFVEDVIFQKPEVKRFQGVRVYSIDSIYLQKIFAITGTRLEEDMIGREVMQGRREARDIFDIYTLSKKIKPLHIFLKGVPSQQQRGMVHWYRTFSRQDLKFELLDLDIYDKRFNAREMIAYLEGEIKKFTKEVIA